MPDRERREAATSDRVVRLTFEYAGNDLRVVDRQEVAMLAPPSDSLEADAAATGFWVELRDSDGAILYRRVLHDPREFDTETIADAGGGVARLPREHPRGVFRLVVPAIDGAQAAVFGRPAGATTAAPAEMIARVDLSGDDTRRGAS